ncbi:hypothetical protein ACIQM0_18330 [Streptomyces sp. NPDC091387]|uniref:hypothetical protein n=1 Tax=Streptomyces sp. NPDC091387 TaxID=3365998 RepID=UPI003813FC2D
MQLTRFRRSVPRSITWSAALLGTVLVTGCSSSSPSDTPPQGPAVTSSVSPPAASSGAPSAPETDADAGAGSDTDAEVSAEPSPVVSHMGKTKVVTLGDVEVRATRGAIGFTVACNYLNSRSQTLNFKVTVSIGDGKEWVRSTKFDFPHLAAGQTGRGSTTVMGDFPEGESPDDPKIYIDSVIEY